MPETEDERPGGSSFRVLSEKTLQIPVTTDLFSWCPTMDLLTFAPDNRSIWLYRMGGQLVWKMSVPKLDVNITSVSWKPDGKLLALGCSDGISRICDVNNGRIVHQIKTKSTVSCLDWVSEDEQAVNNRNQNKFENILNVDIIGALPRLSTLSTASNPDSIFTSKAVLDRMINNSTFMESLSPIDMLFNGEVNGALHINVFGHFSISNISFPVQLKDLNPIDHASTSDLSFHGIIAEKNRDICLLPMRVHFLRRFGNDLAHISSTYMRVQSILMYISDIITGVKTEWGNLRETLDNIMKALRESLGTTDYELIKLKMMEMLLTGVPCPELQSWLSERLSERVLRNWRKAMATCHDNIRKLLLEHLIPACERTIVLITRLRGLAHWRERGVHLGLNPDLFANVVDILSLLLRDAHKLVWDVNREAEHFKPFLQWLKFILDETSNQESPDNETDHIIETNKAFTFIMDYLIEPTIKKFFAEDGDHSLPSVEQKLKIAFVEAFEQSAEAMKNHVILGPSVKILSASAQDKFQVATRAISKDEKQRMFIALSTLDDDQEVTFMIFDISKNPNELVSPIVHVARISVENHFLQSMNFVDDSKFIMLLNKKTIESDVRARLVTIDVHSLQYLPIDCTDMKDDIYNLSKAYNVSEFSVIQSRYYSDDFLPIALTTNGRTGRRVGAVLADDCQRFQVFDLDEDQDDDEAEGNEIREGGDSMIED
ncbi:anaphase-promoting complex, cyclosome, subunit 4-domain-containing protein [Dipodascopsis uninucleata]